MTDDELKMAKLVSLLKSTVIDVLADIFLAYNYG